MGEGAVFQKKGAANGVQARPLNVIYAQFFVSGRIGFVIVQKFEGASRCRGRFNSIFEMDGLCIDAPGGGGTIVPCPGMGAGMIEEIKRMIRFWSFAVLGLACVCAIGCSEGGSSIYAAAPDADFSTHYTVQGGGHFTLFRVTAWNPDGQPAATERVATYDLRPGERLGFNWVTDHGHMYDPDAQMSLEAYAGSHRANLGPIVSRSEKYYWADANGWNMYWAGEPSRRTMNTVTMH